MSASVLTPADSAIFDEDVIAEMEQRLGEVIPCAAKDCDAQATVRIMMRCCGATAFACGPHHQTWRVWFMMRRALASFGVCGDCGRFLPSWVTFAEIVSEVPL